MNLLKKKDISPYLTNGIYSYNEDFTQLSKINIEYSHFKNVVVKKNFKYYLRLLLRKIIHMRIHSNLNLFDGDTVLIPSSKYGLKFFSSRKVLTKFKFNSDFNLYIDNKDKIKKIYKTPNTIVVGDNYIIEEKIESKNYEKSQILIQLMKTFSRHINESSINIENFNNRKRRFIDKYKWFYNKINIDDDYKCCIQHGDLWESNVIFDGKNIFVIDYENVEMRFFLYDFFTYLHNEALIFNNYELLYLYFDGFFDNVLQDLFISLGLNYYDNTKIYYYNIFLNEIINNKFSKYNNKTFFNEMNRLNEIYSNVEKYEKGEQK